MAEADAARAGERFLAGFDPPMLRPIFDPAGTILSCDRALERRSAPGDRRQPFQEIDGGAVERFEPELTTELMDRAFFEIAAEVAQAGEMALSQLLKTAIQKNDPLLPVAVAIKDAFRFRQEADFMAFFLNCVADMNAAEDLRENLEQNLYKMRHRPERHAQLKAARTLKRRIGEFDSTRLEPDRPVPKNCRNNSSASLRAFPATNPLTRESRFVIPV